MVRYTPIYELRPKMGPPFNVSEFIPRTPAIAEAYAWGQKLHAGQKRLSGEPYFETHCAWVAGFIDQLVGNEAWTIAALLHDSVEDQGETLEEIRQRFPGSMGEEVAHIIDGVTKISAPRDGRSRELETLRKIAMFRDPAVFLVKLADKSHNILTLEHMPAAKRVKKAEEAIRAYGKLAGILNCYQWRRWLEDIAFPHADPETFSYVRARIDADPRLQPTFINGMMDQLKRIMENAGLDGEIKVIVNGYWQSWQNLARMARVRRTSLNSFAAVGDVISFRMILDEPVESNCYQLLGHVNRYLGPYLDKDHFEDTIAYPENNFRALLIYGWIPDTGEIEIAITTKDYEGENQWGVVYAIQNRKDISNYRPVEILTPTGGARFLPEGSTVLDAVASIQQEILLDKISAVKVNDALARLSDKVKPGDVLEVITNGSRLQPVEEWLSFANESTRRLLRMVLATESLKRFAEKGRGDIKHLLARRGILDRKSVV